MIPVSASRLSAFAVCSLCCAWPAAHAASSSTLNDTGLRQCVVFDEILSNYVFTSACAGTGQDGEYGRDATAGGNANGRAGFSFVKIGASGEALPKNAAAWNCVRDKVTGLMWEIKTDDGGLRDKDLLFTNLANNQAGDASAYVAAVNAAGLCAANDWRLPTRTELESLLDFSVGYPGTRIDTQWFPNSPDTIHWSSTAADVNAGGPNYRWAVSYYASNQYVLGSFWYGGEYGNFSVRLVRQGKPAPATRWVVRGTGGAELLDKTTRLVWRRCAEGQTWTGSTCSGTPTTYLTMPDAIVRAQSQAGAAGLPWRLPNAKELSTLVDTQRKQPAIDTALFPGFTVESYHTSTPWPENPVYKWRVNFADGEVELDFWGGKLLLVRDAD
jgi:Protein of unknown function (DUF1566)